MRVAPVALGKKSLQGAMPLLVEVRGVARPAVALEFYANDSLARWDHSVNHFFLGVFGAAVEQRMFGARVLVKHQVVTTLILDGLSDEIMNLLRSEFGPPGFVLIYFIAWQGGRPSRG